MVDMESSEQELLNSVTLHSDKHSKFLEEWERDCLINCSQICAIYDKCNLRTLKALMKRKSCPICKKPFKRYSTVKGFCSSKCQKEAKKLYVIEEKKKLSAIIQIRPNFLREKGIHRVTRTREEYKLSFRESKLKWKARKKEIFGDVPQ